VTEEKLVKSYRNTLIEICKTFSDSDSETINLSVTGDSAGTILDNI